MGNTLGFSSVILGRAVAAVNGVTEQHLDTWLKKVTFNTKPCGINLQDVIAVFPINYSKWPKLNTILAILNKT